jgi:hypothetical protein
VPQKANTALNRYGTVDEVAALVAFVASPEAAFITGANLTGDGGRKRDAGILDYGGTGGQNGTGDWRIKANWQRYCDGEELPPHGVELLVLAQRRRALLG